MRNVAEMVVQIPLTQGKFALIDEGDLELVSRYKWCTSRASASRHLYYAVRGVRLPSGRATTQSMHSLITGLKMVDHINGDGLDNRRANLRGATHSQNAANQPKSPVRLTSSRFKGVVWRGDIKKWQVKITARGREIYLGVFSDEMKAALAYDAAARLHFGEYAVTNLEEGARG